MAESAPPLDQIELKLLLSLAVADLLCGLSNIFISPIHRDQLQLIASLITNIATTIFLFCITTSILHISWIALNRLWAVTFPIHNKLKANAKKVHILITLTMGHLNQFPCGDHHHHHGHHRDV